ncbi:ATP-binding protein [Kitasatospora kifunensis]|uniref:Tetratricopeptide (TPR) repeat protein n=1 Tax=Kitasatospora kifunensis TaxID=58351 RepID=A0A7W7VZG0_KITKI|nr:tetratricopeptide repeat protein [Kitasatospora kifunensis]MBB4928752.1 tetratricopeptide (TPR) repeat protein [Kitasatospora kifunensis]
MLAKQVGPLMRPARDIALTTVVDTFKTERRRLDLDLVVAIVRALGADEPTVDRWREACIKVHGFAKQGGPVGVFGQLPTDLATFTGRREELARLISEATHPHEGIGSGAHTVVISAIEGMAGVGKTQLAVRAAHELVRAGRFADLQLHVNLRGFDPELPPADPSAVLEAFLRQLGVPAQQIPASRDERAAMYRDQLRGRSALVLLDNAANEDQVRDLLPASSTSLVLITSRRSLAGLDGVTPYLIDIFSDAESLDLLGRIAGRERVGAEPVAAARIVEYCDHLPLALALAAARLRSRPAWSLAELANRLQTGRLEAIRAGGRAIRPVLDLSYRDLAEPLRRVFCLLGHHPGPDFTPAMVAALCGIPTHEAEDALESLQDENLVRQSTPGRYELHDLLRAFALETAANNATIESSVALERLARWFLHSAHGAATAMNAPRLPELADAGDVAPLGFDSYKVALAWLDAEHENLIAVHRAAAGAKLYDTTWRLPIILNHFENLRFHKIHSAEAHRIAAEAARERGDSAVVAWNLLGASASLHALSRFDEAEAMLTEALRLYRSAHDRHGEAVALGDLGNHYNSLGRYDDAIRVLKRGIAVNEAVGDRQSVIICKLNLGVAYYLLDNLKAATACFQQALTAARACGERRAECIALGNLGEVYLRLGRAERAYAFYSEQQQVAEETGGLEYHGKSLAGLGDTLHAMGLLDEARSSWQKAYAILSEIGSPGADKVRALIQNSETNTDDDRQTLGSPSSRIS